MTANYAYDTKGWRIKKQVGAGSTRYYIYEGVNVLCEFEDKNNNGVVDVADGEGWDYHLYFGLKKIADIKADGREEYYITDHLGTVNAVLDKDAATIQQYAFDPYGNIEYAQGRSDNRYLFTGKEYDAESGVFYFGARYYDSKAGRWLGRDVKEEFYSSYVYCGNNPLGFVDPNGKNMINWAMALSGVRGGSGMSPINNTDSYAVPSNTSEYVGNYVKNVAVNTSYDMVDYAYSFNSAANRASNWGIVVTAYVNPVIAMKLQVFNTASDYTGVGLKMLQYKIGRATSADVACELTSVGVGKLVGDIIATKIPGKEHALFLNGLAGSLKAEASRDQFRFLTEASVPDNIFAQDRLFLNDNDINVDEGAK